MLTISIQSICCWASRIDLDDENSKPDVDDEDGDGTATKDSDSKTAEPKDGEFDRPSSSGECFERVVSTRKHIKSVISITTTNLLSINAGLDDDVESMYNVNASGSGSNAAGQMAGSGQMMGADGTWPSMQDLNTRLRRVITSYQRNYKKEELKQQQKAKVSAHDSERIAYRLIDIDTTWPHIHIGYTLHTFFWGRCFCVLLFHVSYS